MDKAPSDGFHEVQFELQSDRVLRAADLMIPELDKPIDGEVWLRQDVGSTWAIRVAHGSMEIWQYDEGPLVELVRQYYENKK